MTEQPEGMAGGNPKPTEGPPGEIRIELEHLFSRIDETIDSVEQREPLNWNEWSRARELATRLDELQMGEM